MIGIYKITSPTNKVYIGQATNIDKRKSYYKSLNCKNQQKLFHSLKKYGFNAHNFEVLCECKESELTEREDFYIRFYNSIESGLNLKEAGPHGKLSDESKLRISIGNKGLKKALGKKRSDETKKKMSEAMKGKRGTFTGRKHTDQTKATMSKKAIGNKNFLGKKHSESSKIKISKANKGRKFTDEHIKNLSESHKGQKTWIGKKHSKESIEKMRLAKLNKKASPETRLKMSESAKKARARLATGFIETESMAL